MCNYLNKRVLGIAVSTAILVLCCILLIIIAKKEINYCTITSVSKIGNDACIITFEKVEPQQKVFVFRGSSPFRMVQIASTDENYYIDDSINNQTNYYAVSEDEHCSIKNKKYKIGYNSVKTTNVAVLMYHYFNTNEDIENGAFNGIYPEDFEQDLKYFRDHNIKTVTCQDLIDFCDGKIELPEKCLMVTIDDGHYSIYKYAFPLLKKYGCKANISIVGEYIDLGSNSEDRAASPRTNWMNWDEVIELANSELVEIGSHSYFLHNKDFGRYGIRKKEGETNQDYEFFLINDLLPLNDKIFNFQENVNFFAYPYSNPEEDHIDFMRNNIGFRELLCGNSKRWSETNGNILIQTINGRDYNKGVLRRFSRYAGDDIEELLSSIWNDVENDYTLRGIG